MAGNKTLKAFAMDYNYFSNGQFFTISKFHENPNFLRILDSYL